MSLPVVEYGVKSFRRFGNEIRLCVSHSLMVIRNVTCQAVYSFSSLFFLHVPGMVVQYMCYMITKGRRRNKPN